MRLKVQTCKSHGKFGAVVAAHLKVNKRITQYKPAAKTAAIGTNT